MEFNLFEEIIETRTFKPKLEIGAFTLMPISTALHYLEGDSVPLSHVIPVFQAIFSFVQSLEDDYTIARLLEPGDCKKMVELVQERWQGTVRKKGLHHIVHSLAYVLDPMAQAAGATSSDPTSALLNSKTLHAAREALRHHVREPELRSMVAQQLGLWLAARPALPPSSSVAGEAVEAVAVAQGRNAFSSLYLAQMQLIWDKGEARELKIEKEELKRPVPDSDGLGYDLAELL